LVFAFFAERDEVLGFVRFATNDPLGFILGAVTVVGGVLGAIGAWKKHARLLFFVIFYFF
jgi:hypothetical protein